MFDSYRLKNYPLRLILYVLILNIIGVLVIFSATNGSRELLLKQFIGIIIGTVAMIFLSLFPYKELVKLSWLVYGLCIVLLLIVIFFGYRPLNAGAKRWIKLPALGLIQVSEFAKIGLIIFYAQLLTKYREYIDRFRYLLLFAGLLVLPCVLIMAEPDLSTTVVITVIVLCMLFCAGVSYKWIAGGFACAVSFMAVLLFALQHNVIPVLRGYQANRILAWIHPSDYTDMNMQQDNSIMAISSGQLLGKGLNNNTLASVKNGNFLSQEQTDFIFAVIGEELGFVGCIAVVTLYALIVLECLYLASKAVNLQGRLLCTGFAALIAFQSFTNIAVATGLFPNTGLPLPFISYGVSSVVSLFLGVGIVVNVALQRK